VACGTNRNCADAYPVTCHLSPVTFLLVGALFFALGLMSKPMLVTVPFVLLLLDYWPLRRVTMTGGR